MRRIAILSLLLVLAACSKEKSMLEGVSIQIEEGNQESELSHFQFNSSEMVKMAVSATTATNLPAAKAKVGVYAVYGGKEYLLARGIADNWGMAMIHFVKPNRLDEVIVKNLTSHKEVVLRIPKGGGQRVAVKL